MNTATELLRRALDDLELQVGQSIDEIRAFLAAEPLNGAILPNGATATNVYEAYEEGLKEGKAEPATRKPMTEEEISDVLNVDPQWFMDGLNWKALDLLEYARAIERHHGIGGDDE